MVGERLPFGTLGVNKQQSSYFHLNIYTFMISCRITLSYTSDPSSMRVSKHIVINTNRL